MNYRQIKGTSIEVPDWVVVPAFDEFSEEKLARSLRAIRYIRNQLFGSDGAKGRTRTQTRVAEKTKPQPL
ncbi:hypothetical protein V8687_19480 [Shewanella baltica]|uniref:hypothetical protein n=1 Tax=Shewanella baltica TaxID=62322 RepID=UPI0030CECBF6